MARVKRYSIGILRPHGRGKIRAEVNHKYKRYRVVFDNEPEARGWIDQMAVDVANDRPPNLNAVEIADARTARDILPADVTLSDAARAYVRSQGERITLADAVDRYIDMKEGAGLRERTITEVKTHLGRLVEDVGAEMIGAVTTADILAWLDGKQLGGTTRNNHRRTLRGLWNWCMKAGLATSNPTEGVPVVKLDDQLPSVFRPYQVLRFMRAVERLTPEMTAYYALGFFAGIRPAELARLKWSAISDHIHIGSDVAKTRQQRYVDIVPNLAVWIDKCRGGEFVCPFRTGGPISRRLPTLLPMAKIGEEWPADVARHSFATYHLALHKDAGRTSHQMGHSNANMLYSHYRNLATVAEAENYFLIRPRIRPSSA